MKNNSSIWESPQADNLVSALLSIDDPKLMKAFMRDIMTEKEITELSNRLKAAEMLIDSEKYTNVAQVTGLSSRTIARISDWIKQDNGGYQTVINNLKSHHSHILPVRD
jgi:TrpR-related protein YerC/YecD